MNTGLLNSMNIKLLILIVIVGVSIAFTDFVLASALEEYYPLAEGDAWRYSIIEDGKEYDGIVRIAGKEIVGNVETVKKFYSENSYSCFAIDFEGIKEYKNYEGDEYQILNPARLILPNIGLGESKAYTADVLTYKIGGERIKSSKESGEIMLLSGIDNVEVPAGRFTNCLKFSSFSKEKKENGSYDISDCSIWLALGVGMVKQTCLIKLFNPDKGENDFSETQELVSAVIGGKQIGGHDINAYSDTLLFNPDKGENDFSETQD